MSGGLKPVFAPAEVNLPADPAERAQYTAELLEMAQKMARSTKPASNSACAPGTGPIEVWARMAALARSKARNPSTERTGLKPTASGSTK